MFLVLTPQHHQLAVSALKFVQILAHLKLVGHFLSGGRLPTQSEVTNFDLAVGLRWQSRNLARLAVGISELDAVQLGWVVRLHVHDQWLLGGTSASLHVGDEAALAQLHLRSRDKD